VLQATKRMAGERRGVAAGPSKEGPVARRRLWAAVGSGRMWALQVHEAGMRSGRVHAAPFAPRRCTASVRSGRRGRRAWLCAHPAFLMSDSKMVTLRKM
jgi:hypothetical protein